MKVEVFFDDKPYGTVETTKKGLVVTGDTKSLNRLVKDMQDEQTDDAFVEGLLTRLRGRMWAREVN